jgi:hypothetical protein
MNYLSTWIYIEPQTEQGIYPQVGALSIEQRQAVYWRCIYCFFTTAARFRTNIESYRLRLYTNCKSLPQIDGTDLAAAFAELNVETICLPYTWQPQSARKMWFNQFYLFDILNNIAQTTSNEDLHIIADSDCVFVHDPARLFERLKIQESLLITVETSETEDINGLSRQEAREVYHHLSGHYPSAPPEYFGGEFYGLTGRLAKDVSQQARHFKTLNDDRAGRNALHLSDEAHFFSFLMWRMGIVQANANDLVRRIWTTWNANNTTPADLSLSVWHVPAEKIYGLLTLFRLLSDKSSAIHHLDEAAFRVWLAKELGVGRLSFQKFIGHLTRGAMRRAKRFVPVTFQSTFARPR